ncbi:hypothetical protein MMPV_001966 [Pyropia vietnamensis]
MRYGDTSATHLSQRLATQSEALIGDHIGSFDEGAGGHGVDVGRSCGGHGRRPAPVYTPPTLELTAPPISFPVATRPRPRTPAAPVTTGAGPATAAIPSPSRQQPRRRIRPAPQTQPFSSTAVAATLAPGASAAQPQAAVVPSLPPGTAGMTSPSSPAGPCMTAVTSSSPGRLGERVAAPVDGATSPTLSLVSPPRGQQRVCASAPAGGVRLDKRQSLQGSAAATAAPAAVARARGTGSALVATARPPGRLRTRAASAAGGPAPSNWPRRRPRQLRLELVPVSQKGALASRDEEQPSEDTGHRRKRPRRSSSPLSPLPSSPLARGATDPQVEDGGSHVVSVATSDGRDASNASLEDALTAAASDKARAAEEEGVGDEDDFAEAVLHSGRKVAEAARRARLGLRSRSSSPVRSASRSSGSSTSSLSSTASQSSGGTSSSSGRVRPMRRRLVLEVSSDSDASSGG